MHIYLMSELTNSLTTDAPKRSGSITERWHTFLARLSKATRDILPTALIIKLTHAFTSQ